LENAVFCVKWGERWTGGDGTGALRKAVMREGDGPFRILCPGGTASKPFGLSPRSVGIACRVGLGIFPGVRPKEDGSTYYLQ
jgi:hypothetical protein